MIVDANVWVANDRPADAFHVASGRWIHQQVAGGVQFFDPLLVLAEVAGAIARITGSPLQGRRVFRDLAAMPGLHLVPADRALFMEAAALAADLRLRGADSVYVAVARRLGLPLVTWDQEVSQRAAAVITVLHP